MLGQRKASAGCRLLLLLRMLPLSACVREHCREQRAYINTVHCVRRCTCCCRGTWGTTTGTATGCPCATPIHATARSPIPSRARARAIVTLVKLRQCCARNIQRVVQAGKQRREGVRQRGQRATVVRLGRGAVIHP